MDRSWSALSCSEMELTETEAEMRGCFFVSFPADEAVCLLSSSRTVASVGISM